MWHVSVNCFPGGSVVKNLPANVGNRRDLGSIPRLERSPVGRNSNPLQYSCLENAMKWGAWWTTVYSVTKSRTQQQLSKHNKYIITFYGLIIFHGTKLCLSILQLMDILVTFWLLWIWLIWQFLYICLCEHRLSCLLVIYLGMELLPHMVALSLIFEELPKSFPQ